MKLFCISQISTLTKRHVIPVPLNADMENASEPEYRVVSSRKFIIKKYSALDGIKVIKVFLAKILPVFQNFMPLVNEARKGSANAEHILANLGQYLTLDNIAESLDKVSPDDLDYIMRASLMSVYEALPAGDATVDGIRGTQVLNSDGSYGVMDVEHDPLIVLRLVCEAVMWGVGDFFDGNRLRSVVLPTTRTAKMSSLPTAKAR